MYLAHPHGEEATHLATTNILVAAAIILLILAAAAYIVFRQVTAERQRNKEAADTAREMEDLNKLFPPQ
jgi:heme/copper-type cytochrome/quinol oxidase subunit 2